MGVTLAKPVVLIVEDNEETAVVLGRILELRGYHVAFASDGLEALAYLRGGLAPVAIILDLALPNLDGRALRTALLATPAFARIPIVVYSAVSGGEQLPGVIGHVRKGF